MGLDLSINSTGVCIRTDSDCIYKIITPHITRSMRRSDDEILEHIEYQKSDNDDHNIYMIKEAIRSLIKEYNISHVTLEAPALQAKGRSVITLAGLNYSIRQMLLEEKIPFDTVQPSALKKWFTGNGKADKNLMCHCWRALEPHSKQWKSIKVDDIADAYALAHFQAL